MSSKYIQAVGVGYFPEKTDDIMTSLFKEYERVIIESIITSFGLDFLTKDQHGGDVDTIHNVRQVGKDAQMTYKSEANRKAYENRGAYDSHAYHSAKGYRDKNKEVSQLKKSGQLVDAYTGEKIAINGKSDLDHVISAKEVHDDAGRVLAGLSGIELANSDENLKATNPRTNRTKKADTMDDFISKYGDEYTESQKDNMRQKDAEARKAYEYKLAQTYYTSPQFVKNVSLAAGKVGVQMGLRQVLGFVFTEVWFAIKEEFSKIGKAFDLSKFFYAIGEGIKKGFENAKTNYKTLLAKFQDGAVAGALSSLTTTLCNIFFTTAKNVVKVIRQSYASLVQAAKVLFINPDNLLFGERMRAVVKILATGASVVVGGLVSEAIGKTPLGLTPVIGDIVQTFCGTLVTGVMSCSLLFFFDRSEVMNKLVRALDHLPSMSKDVEYFAKQARYFESYAAELMQLDLKKFQQEIRAYVSCVSQIDQTKTEQELNKMLLDTFNIIGIKIPWEGSFDSFMRNKKAVLVFK